MVAERGQVKRDLCTIRLDRGGDLLTYLIRIAARLQRRLDVDRDVYRHGLTDRNRRADRALRLHV